MSRKRRPEPDPYFAAYCAAKARHQAAVAALKRAKVPEPELAERRRAAAKAEFKALAALLSKPRAALAVEMSPSDDLVGMELVEG